MKKSWKQRLDELELQLALGVMEGRQAFEDQKEKLKQYIAEAKTMLDTPEGISEELRQKLQAQLEEAEVQLALGKAEGKEAYARQKDLIDNALRELQETLREVKSTGNEQIKEWITDFAATVQMFRIQLDVFNVYYALGKAEAEEKTEEYRAQVREKIALLRKRIDEWTDDDKWEDFAEELQHSVFHFGKAFKRLLG